MEIENEISSDDSSDMSSDERKNISHSKVKQKNISFIDDSFNDDFISDIIEFDEEKHDEKFQKAINNTIQQIKVILETTQINKDSSEAAHVDLIAPIVYNAVWYFNQKSDEYYKYIIIREGTLKGNRFTGKQEFILQYNGEYVALIEAKTPKTINKKQTIEQIKAELHSLTIDNEDECQGAYYGFLTDFWSCKIFGIHANTVYHSNKTLECEEKSYKYTKELEEHIKKLFCVCLTILYEASNREGLI